MTLTRDSLDLFIAIAEDAGNWSGNPLAGAGHGGRPLTAAQRGNFTDLKRHGLLETFESDGAQWVAFTEAGIAFAGQHGVDLTWIDEMARARREGV